MSESKEEREARERDERIRNTAIVRLGDQISVPDGMLLEDAIKALQRKLHEEEQTIYVEEVFEVNPLEGALAFNEALVQKFKWVSMQAKTLKGFFGNTEIPPRFINVPVAQNKTVQVPWGQLSLPGISGYIETGFKIVKRRPVFQITGEIKQKSKELFAEICMLTRQVAATQSIYKGKAIKAVFPNLEETTSMEDFFPEFMDLNSIDSESLIFSKELEHIIGVTLFTPIERTNVCRTKSIPLKRGILLEGPYGVGKTLTAHVTARKCVDNGWTFIYIKSVTDLADAIEMARQYQPAVVFSEDLDQALKGNNRDQKIDNILNTIDGIDAKGTEIIVVLTTNHLENITQAMLRPERLDAVVPIRPPDAEAVQRLIRLFAGDKINPNEDLSEVGQKLAGHIPASIHEVVQRSALAAIYRTGDDAQITSDDLIVVANGMLEHLKLLAPQVKDERSDIEKAAEKGATILGQHIQQASSKVDLHETIKHAKSLLDHSQNNGRSASETPQHTAIK